MMNIFTKAIAGMALAIGIGGVSNAAITINFEGVDIEAEEYATASGIYFWEFLGNDKEGGSQNPEFGELLDVQGYNIVGSSDDDLNFTLNDGGDSGTWSSNYAVNAFVVKAGSSFLFVDFDATGPVFSSNWCTTGDCTIGGVDLSQYNDGQGNYDFALINKGGNEADMSHLSLYALTSAVPEPATWLMMIMGFGMIGAATRRRRKIALS
ncbi:hypothetical protein GCM10017044_24060 [Kordiimonas sediminis]|uniref:Ice-binding protein C-terminal domain-containing protein n=1 Tax=Kordiimonas sediminis TaxID=1735581 RepID=A0A919AXF7_9PROT|nr:PEPxxWA-CTERM sorting domain-containing protein [Kordiimonas sediminis]GHF28062.1 hypothetical protein GCM10017044_24060 [Kordiimonas sediminis]